MTVCSSNLVTVGVDGLGRRTSSVYHTLRRMAQLLAAVFSSDSAPRVVWVSSDSAPRVVWVSSDSAPRVVWTVVPRNSLSVWFLRHSSAFQGQNRKSSPSVPQRITHIRGHRRTSRYGSGRGGCSHHRTFPVVLIWNRVYPLRGETFLVELCFVRRWPGRSLHIDVLRHWLRLDRLVLPVILWDDAQMFILDVVGDAPLRDAWIGSTLQLRQTPTLLQIAFPIYSILKAKKVTHMPFFSILPPFIWHFSTSLDPSYKANSSGFIAKCTKHFWDTDTLMYSCTP